MELTLPDTDLAAVANELQRRAARLRHIAYNAPLTGREVDDYRARARLLHEAGRDLYNTIDDIDLEGS